MTELRHKLAVACVTAASALLAAQPTLHAQSALAALKVTSTSASAVPARITQKVDESKRATMAGHLRPFLSRATDHGEVSSNTKTLPIMLMFSRTAQQQADLDALADNLHNKNSSSFHKWLTPAEFGAKFSPADSDVATVKAWLESKGFQVLDVPPSKTFISFVGTTGQLKSAFGVSIHSISIDGENHVATVTEPQIPAAFASVVGGLHGLDDFHGKPTMVKHVPGVTPTAKAAVAATGGAKPSFTTSNADGTNYLIGPQDFYTIYNENPLLKAGITGAGQTIAVLEEAQVAPADVTTFRAAFGLPAYPATPNATQGGVNYLIGSSTGLNGYASCYAPATLTAAAKSGEEGEAALDLQWSGAVAPNATVDFVACGGSAKSADGTSPGAYGTDHSAQYVVNYLAGTVVAASMSYGECEADMTASTTSGVGYYNNQWQQFAVEGITPIISTGDAGSTQCYQNATAQTTLPPSVNGFASSAWNVGAGGTDFADLYETNGYSTAPASTWWSSTNGAGYSSALSYVPETSWAGYCSNRLFVSYLQANNSTFLGSTYTTPAFCSNSTSIADGYTAVVGGAGGISTINTIPSWQSVYGIGKNSVSSTYRNLPDVSLFAANGFWGHILPFCESDSQACTLANWSSATSELLSGGTSFVAPQLAGFFALVAQKTGMAQGQANYTLYNLAAQQYGTTSTASSSLASCSGSGLKPGSSLPSSCIFQDISNDTPSLQGGTIATSNEQPCLAKDANCYSTGTLKYGVTTVPGTTASAGVIAFTSAPGYDNVTGLGSFNITNLVNNWTTVTPLFPSTTTLVSSAPIVAPSKSVTLTATVQATGRSNSLPAGTVTFYAGTSSLGTGSITSTCTGTNATTTCKGTASLTVLGSAFPGSSNSITAAFGGDSANDAPSTSSAVSVAVGATTLTVPAQTYSTTASTSPLTATINFSGPLPTGAVSFKVGALAAVNATCNISASATMSCTAQYPTSGLAGASSTLTVTLLADSNYDSKSGSGALTPGSSKPTVNITVPATVTPVGAASTTITASATFTNGVIPMGVTTISIDGANTLNAGCYLTSGASASCSATLPTGSLSAGSHTITVTNAGDANYSTSTGTGVLTVATPL